MALILLEVPFTPILSNSTTPVVNKVLKSLTKLSDLAWVRYSHKRVHLYPKSNFQIWDL